LGIHSTLPQPTDKQKRGNTKQSPGRKENSTSFNRRGLGEKKVKVDKLKGRWGSSWVLLKKGRLGSNRFERKKEAL